MNKKILLRLDKASITEAQLFTIQANPLLTHLEDDLYVFRFDSLEFTHALMLLGPDESKYGFNLTNYLECTLSFLGHHVEEYLTLSNGSTDFRKRASEDLGVAVASLFMVTSFNLDWKTIMQIPRNVNLSKKTPDFSGFSYAKEQYIFECKGTSVSQNVETQINKALEQVKHYPIPDARKFAISSYFSNNKKIFYPISFVFDPPFDGNFPLDEETSINIHYLDVLRNIGLKQTSADLQKAVATKLNLEKQKGRSINIIEDRTLRSEVDQTVQGYSEETKQLATMQHKGKVYVGQRWTQKLRTGLYEIFFGLEEDIARRTVRMEKEKKTGDSERAKEEDDIQTSVFSDGTIFQVRRLE